ncbi:MAG: cysteine synthase A [Paludibacteraceae bacterium]|nr:cysteine synthase A [Paludibacteraceae bacterium]
MKRIYSNIIDTVGGTPLVTLERYSQQMGLTSTLVAKVEAFNPGGSAKDRVAVQMLKQAAADGLLQAGATIIEPTSGNTGIGLAMACAVLGYKLILTMPDTMSIERIKLAQAYGAEVVLTPGAQGMKGAIEKANTLLQEIKGAWMAGQFTNPANPMAHYLTTGPEIWADTDGKIDIFVAGIGTGGNISGVGNYLKEQKNSIEIVGAEPAESAVLNGNPAGPHKIQGIGAGFIPDNYNAQVVDKVIDITSNEALEKARLLAKTEGILVGISSGCALAAATQLALLPENAGKTIVVLLPDTGERYLSTELFK